MKLILAVDPLHPPLTGIGRYTWELATRLDKISDIADLKYYNLGKWHDKISIYNDSGSDSVQSSVGQRAFGHIRTTLSKSMIATSVYRKISPLVESVRLSGYGDYLYHSPNFILPKFEGRKIATIHDLSIFRHPEFHPPARVAFLRHKVPEAIEVADRLIAISQFVADEIVEYFQFPRNRISVTPLGVSESYYPREGDELRTVLNRYGIESNHYFLSVATLEPRKNISALLRAYKRLPQIVRNHYPLVLCGDAGWLNKEILGVIQKAERDGWARRIGYVPESDMPYLYSGAKGFLYPSLYEGFGLPVLEAFACNCPVVTSNGSALTELALNAATLIDPHDDNQITEAIEGIIDKDNIVEAKRAQGRMVAKRHTWDNCVEKTVAAYQATYNDKPPKNQLIHKVVI